MKTIFGINLDQTPKIRNFSITVKNLKSTILLRFSRYIDKLSNKKFYSNYYGNKPQGSKEEYLEIWGNAKSLAYPEIDKIELQYKYSVSKEWIDELALSTQVVKKGSDICYQHGRILYTLLSSYISKNPNQDYTIVETGTARGFSSICMAKAISDMHSFGKITTFDIIPCDEAMFWGCIEDHNGPQTRLQLLKNYNSLLSKIIFIQGDTKIQAKKFCTNRVNFAFLDGGHGYDDVINDYNLVSGRQEKGDIVIFDDYTPSMFPEIVTAVDEICHKYQYNQQIIMGNKDRGYCIGIKK